MTLGQEDCYKKYKTKLRMAEMFVLGHVHSYLEGWVLSLISVKEIEAAKFRISTGLTEPATKEELER